MRWTALMPVAATVILGSLGLGAAPAAAQQLRLEEQRVEGVDRVCIYRSLREEEVRRVGRGEPCPFRYRKPVARVEHVPAFATLHARQYANGQTVCVYRYLGQDYRMLLPGGSYCTYTPQSFPH